MEEAIKGQHALEQRALKEIGYYVHLVPDERLHPKLTNIHSHGFDLLNHLDVQVVVRCPENIVKDLFFTLHENIKNGQRYEPGKDYFDVAHGYGARFILAREGGREVLRLIICDPAGNLDADKITPPFDLQYQYLDTGETNPYEPTPAAVHPAAGKLAERIAARSVKKPEAE